MKGCWTLSNAFSASIEMIVWFSTFLLLMWCMTLICICWTWRWIPPGCGVWSFLYVVGFSWLKFVENFCIYSHQRYWPAIFFFGSIFVWFLVLGWWWIHRTFFGMVLLLQCFTCEALSSWTVVCRECFFFFYYIVSFIEYKY